MDAQSGRLFGATCPEVKLINAFPIFPTNVLYVTISISCTESSGLPYRFPFLDRPGCLSPYYTISPGTRSPTRITEITDETTHFILALALSPLTPTST